MTVAFMRNKMVEVEPLPTGNLAVYWRLSDDLIDVDMTLTFQLPDLEIVDAAAHVRRSPHREGVKAGEVIRKMIGVRVGGGLRKIVRGLMGGDGGNIDLTEGVLECCNAVILNFTLPGIQEFEKYTYTTEEERLAPVRAMLQANPRLYRSCVAFAEDSPIVRGLDLKGGVS
ncbi:MAG: DUF2889 domain-containing protein [Syntrophaceae bacterium]|nr:DUF2889 domain-containing protein [Syntrophaceae bacterium]